MAYSYSGWRLQSGAAAQLAMLDLHIGEVAAQMGIDTSGPDHSVNRKELVNYYQSLVAERKEFVTLAEASTRKYFSRARLRRN